MATVENGQTNASNTPVTGTTDIPLRTISPSSRNDGTQGANLNPNNTTPTRVENSATDRLISPGGLGLDVTLNGEADLPPEINNYRTRKTATEGLMDLALLTANASQLRFLLRSGNNDLIDYISICFIILSLILQVGVGAILLLSTRYTICAQQERKMVFKCGDYVLLGTFLITVINAFVATFSDPSTPQINGSTT